MDHQEWILTPTVWERNIGEKHAPFWDLYPIDTQYLLDATFKNPNSKNAICKIDGVEHTVVFDRGGFLF